MANEWFQNEAFLRGVQAGVQRATRHDVLRRLNEDSAFVWRNASERLRAQVPEMPRALSAELNYVGELLRETQASDRFTELFGEMTTVAVIAREAYGDPALTRDEIESYQDRSSAFFNSFRHA